MDDSPGKTIFRKTVDFVSISYVIIIGHVIVLTLTIFFRAPIPDQLVGGGTFMSSAIFVLKMNERLTKIESRGAQSIATLLIFPGWLVVFFIELFVFIDAILP